MLKTIDACGQLAGALSRFLTHEQNIGQVCAAAVEVDIMIEQLRAGGMGAIMADEKIRKLHCLARRLLPQDAPQTTDAAFAPDNLINDALDAGEQALALYNRGGPAAPPPTSVWLPGLSVRRSGISGMRHSIASVKHS